jgi:nucleotide-binding universal stress UspA family protein
LREELNMGDTPVIKPIKSILCAIDLSDISPHVLGLAAEFAEAYDARLIVLHVVEIWDKRYDFIVSEIAKRIEVEAHGKLQSELDRLGKSHGVPVEVVVQKGQAVITIQEAIRKFSPDLLVMGSHGKRGIDSLLLGSVAERILRVSPVSVLVVRPPKNPDIYTLLCAVDLSDCSRTALERSIEIAKQDKIAAIKVLHVFEVPIGYLEAGMAYETALAKTREIHQREFDEFIAPFKNCGVTCELILEEGVPGTTIVKYADSINADLLVIGAHGKSRLTAMLIGGISTKIVHRSTVPVLAVKAPQHFESLWQALEKL